MKKEYLNPNGLPAIPGFSQVVSTTGGRTIYIAGQVSLNQKGELVGKGSLGEQTRQTFENLKTALASVGATFSDLVKVNYYVVGLNPTALAEIRSVRANYLPKENPPASTLVGVPSLFMEDVLIEIDGIAVLAE